MIICDCLQPSLKEKLFEIFNQKNKPHPGIDHNCLAKQYLVTNLVSQVMTYFGRFNNFLRNAIILDQYRYRVDGRVEVGGGYS